MDSINDKLSDSKKLVIFIQEYFTRLQPLLDAGFSSEKESIEELINKIPKMEEAADKKLQSAKSLLKDSKDFEEITSVLFDLFHHLQNLYLSINNAYKLFDAAYLQAENISGDDLSRTYKLETQEYLNKIKLKHKLFVEAHLTSDIEIINLVSDMIIAALEYDVDFTDTNKLLISVDYIRDNFYQQKNTINLYVNIMQKLIDKTYQENKTVLFKILSYVEEDKSFFISGQTENALPSKFKDRHIKNPAMKRFGLVPSTSLLPINEIIALMMAKPFKGKLKLPVVAKKLNACIIQFIHVVYNPIEYDVNQLFKPSKEPQSESYGITKELIGKFNIIKPIKMKKDKWHFDVSFINYSDKIDNFFIIETLDGDNWRLLTPWVNTNKYQLPRFRIKSLIDYYRNDNKPDRVSNYQAMCIKKATQHMFLPKPLSMETMEEYSQGVDSQQLRNSVFLKIRKQLMVLIGNASKIKSDTQINKIIHDESLGDIFVEVVLSMYDLGSKLRPFQEYSAGKFPFSEMLIGYLRELTRLRSRFMKDLHDGYNRSPFKNDVFKQSNKKQIISDRLEELLNVVINNLINNKDNIYILLNYKFLLLNFV